MDLIGRFQLQKAMRSRLVTHSCFIYCHLSGLCKASRALQKEMHALLCTLPCLYV